MFASLFVLPALAADPMAAYTCSSTVFLNGVYVGDALSIPSDTNGLCGTVTNFKDAWIPVEDLAYDLNLSLDLSPRLSVSGSSLYTIYKAAPVGAAMKVQKSGKLTSALWVNTSGTFLSVQTLADVMYAVLKSGGDAIGVTAGGCGACLVGPGD